MFEAIYKLTANIKKLNINTISVSVFALPDTKKFILRLNRVEQLYNEGIDINDKIIGVYSYATAILTGEESYIYNGLVNVKKAGEPYTLYDSGEFYESFSVVMYKDGFTIKADTEKLNDSINQKQILGLTDESKNELAKNITPLLQEAIREAILKEVL